MAGSLPGVKLVTVGFSLATNVPIASPGLVFQRAEQRLRNDRRHSRDCLIDPEGSPVAGYNNSAVCVRGVAAGEVVSHLLC